MLSFIIIGKNEEHNIKRCINSVAEFINVNFIKFSEIIFVDSCSTDNTLQIVQNLNLASIYKICGEVNAAVARNVGASFSKGNILFFIDGDMEIDPLFYNYAFQNGQLVYPFVSGQYLSHFYINGVYQSQSIYHSNKEDVYETTTGGIFLIHRELWQNVGGMKNKYRRSQDIDLGLRLSKKGFKLFRLNKIIATHHTVSYYDKTRLWKDLFNYNQLYQKSVLYRDHFFNKHIYKFFLREITLIVLFISICCSMILNNYWVLFIYMAFLFLKGIYKSNNGVSPNLFIRISYYFLLDLYTFFGLFFFWPINKKIFSVSQITTFNEL